MIAKKQQQVIAKKKKGGEGGAPRHLLNPPLYITFITNNHASFHLWWNENLVEYQKVSKYYDQDYICAQKNVWNVYKKFKFSWTQTWFLQSIGKEYERICESAGHIWLAYLSKSAAEKQSFCEKNKFLTETLRQWYKIEDIYNIHRH